MMWLPFVRFVRRPEGLQLPVSLTHRLSACAPRRLRHQSCDRPARNLVHERGAGNLDRQRVGAADQRRDGGLQRPRAAALRQRNRLAHGEDLRTPAAAMAVHGGGRSRGERVRGAGRGDLYHPRDHAVSRQRGGARRRSRTRDRPRHRAAFGAAVHAAGRRPGGSHCARHIRPGGATVRRPGRAGARRAVPQIRARRRAAVRSAGCAIRVAARMGSGGGPGVSFDARTARRSGRRSTGRSRTGCPPTRIRSRA